MLIDLRGVFIIKIDNVFDRLEIILPNQSHSSANHDTFYLQVAINNYSVFISCYGHADHLMLYLRCLFIGMV
ncbi:MAG: hypothetical protein ACJAV0_000268 [Shewanella sp.]|jgi:hypothetical protein